MDLLSLLQDLHLFLDGVGCGRRVVLRIDRPLSRNEKPDGRCPRVVAGFYGTFVVSGKFPGKSSA